MTDKSRPRRVSIQDPAFTYSMEQPAPQPLMLPDVPSNVEDSERPSQSSEATRPGSSRQQPPENTQKGLMRSAANSRQPDNRLSTIHSPGSEYERIFDDPPPQRHPAHQHPHSRLGQPPPPPTEAYYDEERGQWGPPAAYPYPPLKSGSPYDGWQNEAYYGPPPGRPRTGSMRSVRSNRPRYGPPPRRSAVPPPSQPPYKARHPYWEEPSENESDDDLEAARPKGMYGGGAPPRRPGSPVAESEYRIPFTAWMNHHIKTSLVAFLGEFVGTTMFLMMAFSGTLVANIGAKTSTTTTNASTGFSPIVLMYIAASFGFSLMVNVWIFFRISGGLFNPAVTFGMLLVKAVTPMRAILLVIAQIAGSILASWLTKILIPTDFNVRTTLSADTSVARGVFIEALLTAELVFTIFMLAKEKHKATHLAPIGIGIALFAAELVGVYFTGGSLNPARSLGPCVVTGLWDKEHWIYWLGPAVGALIAVALYRVIKVLDYELANPGQDKSTEIEAEADAKAAGITAPPAAPSMMRKPSMPSQHQSPYTPNHQATTPGWVHAPNTPTPN